MDSKDHLRRTEEGSSLLHIADEELAGLDQHGQQVAMSRSQCHQGNLELTNISEIKNIQEIEDEDVDKEIGYWIQVSEQRKLCWECVMEPCVCLLRRLEERIRRLRADMIHPGIGKGEQPDKGNSPSKAKKSLEKLGEGAIGEGGAYYESTLSASNAHKDDGPLTCQEEIELEQEECATKDKDRSKVEKRKSLTDQEADGLEQKSRCMTGSSRKSKVGGSLEDQERSDLFLSPQEQTNLKKGGRVGSLEAQEQPQLVLHPQNKEERRGLEDQEHQLVLAPQEQKERGNQELDMMGGKSPGLVRKEPLLEDQEHGLVLIPQIIRVEEVQMDGEKEGESLLEMMRRKSKEHQELLEQEKTSTPPGRSRRKGGKGLKGKKIENLNLTKKQEKSTSVMTMVKTMTGMNRKEQTYEEWKEEKKKTAEAGTKKRKAEADGSELEFDKADCKRSHQETQSSVNRSNKSEMGPSKVITNKSKEFYNQGGVAEHVRDRVGGQGGDIARSALNRKGSNWLTRLGDSKRAK